MTPDEYRDHAIAFRAEKDGYPVIDPTNNPQEWAIWMEFFREQGHKWTVEEMERRRELKSGTWTVPTLDPQDFMDWVNGAYN